MLALQDISSKYVATNFRKLPIEAVAGLPPCVISIVAQQMRAIDLNKMERALGVHPDAQLWLKHYKNRFPIRYRNLFKDLTKNVTRGLRSCHSAFCGKDFRRLYLEDYFHTLLEDVGTALAIRGEDHVGSSAADAVESEKPSSCLSLAASRAARLHALLVEAAEAAEHVRCLRVRLPLSLLLLRDDSDGCSVRPVLAALLRSVTCLRLTYVSAHFAGLLRLVRTFVAAGRLHDFHCDPNLFSRLDPQAVRELLLMLSSLEEHVPSDTPVPTAVVEPAGATLTPGQPLSPLHSLVTMQPPVTDDDLYDMAIAGHLCDDTPLSSHFLRTDTIPSTQSSHPVSQVCLSPFLWPRVHEMPAFLETVLQRWRNLRRITLACLNHVEVEGVRATLLLLLRRRQLTDLCLEDCALLDPLQFFADIAAIASFCFGLHYLNSSAFSASESLDMGTAASTGESEMMREELDGGSSKFPPTPLLHSLSLVGVGQLFEGAYLADEMKLRPSFYGIVNLDLSFSSLSSDTGSIALAAYLQKDKMLRYVNLQSCKLRDRASCEILRALGESTVNELIYDFNPINSEEVEQALTDMLQTNRNFKSLSLTFCHLREAFFRTALVEKLYGLGDLDRLSLADNRLGDSLELTNYISAHLRRKRFMEHLDVSSCCMSARYLLALGAEVTATLTARSVKKLAFTVLNISNNMLPTSAAERHNVDSVYEKLCVHYFALTPYGDPDREHVAQM